MHTSFRKKGHFHFPASLVEKINQCGWGNAASVHLKIVCTFLKCISSSSLMSTSVKVMLQCSSGIYLWRSRDSGVADNMCGNVCIWWYKHPWWARAECRRKCTMLCVILKFSSVNSIWRLTTIVCEIVVIVLLVCDADGPRCKQSRTLQR